MTARIGSAKRLVARSPSLAAYSVHSPRVSSARCGVCVAYCGLLANFLSISSFSVDTVARGKKTQQSEPKINQGFVESSVHLSNFSFGVGSHLQKAALHSLLPFVFARLVFR